MTSDPTGAGTGAKPPGPGAPEPTWATPPPPAAPPSGPARPDQWGPPPPQQPGAWGAAPQPPAPAQPPQPDWVAAGPPQAGWAGGPPPPASGGSGCLKGCLIATAILLVVGLIAVIGLVVVGARFIGGLGVDENGNLRPCPIVSSAELQTVLGPDAQAAPLSGLADVMIGRALDKRVLATAESCWMGASLTDTRSAFGRIAEQSGSDAASVFASEKAAAQSGGYFAIDVPGAGDEAFCTGWTADPATGALVRRGDRLVYVSFVDSSSLNFDQATGDAGVVYSPQACDDAVRVALLALK